MDNRAASSRTDADMAWMDQPSTSSGVTTQLSRYCGVEMMNNLDLESSDEELDQSTSSAGLLQPKIDNRAASSRTDADMDWMDQPSSSSGVTNQLNRFSADEMMNSLDLESSDEELDQSTSGDASSQLPPTEVETEEPSVPPEEVTDIPKKKRGRPPKSNRAPTRVSQRVKKPVERKDCVEKPPKRCWSKEEKQQLLKGLQEFGINNIKAVQRYLPTRSDYEIRQQIRFYQNWAQERLENRLITEKMSPKSARMNSVNKLNEWIGAIEHLQKDSPRQSWALSIFFELAAEYGEFPSKEEAGGVDFRALYRYIDCMLNGEPFYGLNPETKQVLSKMLRRTDLLARECLKAGLIVPELQKCPVQKEKEIKTYGRPKQNKRLTVEDICNSPDMNPLGLPPWVLDLEEIIKRKSEQKRKETRK